MSNTNIYCSKQHVSLKKNGAVRAVYFVHVTAVQDKNHSFSTPVILSDFLVSPNVIRVLHISWESPRMAYLQVRLTNVRIVSKPDAVI